MNEFIVKQGFGRTVQSDFLRLPRKIYADDPLWVPPLIREVRRTLDVRKNPYFGCCTQQRFVCYRNGVPVARTIVVIDPSQRDDHGGLTASFGFFESIDDVGAVRALFTEAGRFARAHGAAHLEGPFNPNYYSEIGIKTDAFDCAPRFYETYNPPYYAALLGALGFQVSHRIATYALSKLPDAVLRRFGNAAPAKAGGVFTVRPLRMRTLAQDLEQIRDVYNDAFSANPYFHDVSREEYSFSAKYLRYVTEPELTSIVESQGRAVAVVQIMQDVNPLLQRMHGSAGPLRLLRYERDRKKIRAAVLYAVGIKKAFRCSYVLGMLLRGVIGNLQHFERVSTTWVSEYNRDMISVLTMLGFAPDRSFAMYQQQLY